MLRLTSRSATNSLASRRRSEPSQPAFLARRSVRNVLPTARHSMMGAGRHDGALGHEGPAPDGREAADQHAMGGDADGDPVSSPAMSSCWLVKQEPSAYPFSKFLEDGRTTWDGVRNAQARIHLRAMKKGDDVLYYHSGDDKAVVGLAKVTRAAYPDPTDPDGAWVAVDLRREGAPPSRHSRRHQGRPRPPGHGPHQAVPSLRHAPDALRVDPRPLAREKMTPALD